MRWPIRNQILLRTIFLIALTILAITLANIRSTISENRQQESKQIEEILELFQSTRYPINTPILESMKSLSNAEFAFVDSTGQVVASTQASPIELLPKQRLDKSVSGTPAVVELEGESFFHSVVERIGDSPPNQSGKIHVFVPRKTDRELRWQASRTPLWIAFIVLPIACLVSIALSSQVSRPLARLRSQVQEIARGKHSQITTSRTNDEILDLGRSINEMSKQLKENEVELRASERLKNMFQFGNGVAHHLRNSATGCKMAVQLMAEDCPGVKSHEAYEVSMRQFDLMDRYLRKFLSLSKISTTVSNSQFESIDLAKVLESSSFLLQPTAKHLGVKLSVDIQGAPKEVRISNDDAEQVTMNLIGNAITAASEGRRENSSPEVKVELIGLEKKTLLVVHDNGGGPPAEIEDSIFDPFVTGAKEGTGMGLALVQEVAESSGGAVSWERSGGWTVFTFEFVSEKN